MPLVLATITDVSHAATDPARKVVTVLFNPTDLTVESGSHYASMPVPGLAMPILQYIRGESDMLHLEVFLDRIDQNSDIENDIIQLEGFVTIDSGLHAPPVVEFAWGQSQFSFTGVVTSLRKKMTLFSEDGRTLR